MRFFLDAQFIAMTMRSFLVEIAAGPRKGENGRQ